MSTVLSAVENYIAGVHAGEMISPADLFHFANSKSTIYNILSEKTLRGELARLTNGVYALAHADVEKIPAAEIAMKKAARFNKTVDAKEQTAATAECHEFWTNGRSTCFRLLHKGQVIGSIMLVERSRTEAKPSRVKQHVASQTPVPLHAQRKSNDEIVTELPVPVPVGNCSARSSKQVGCLERHLLQLVRLELLIALLAVFPNVEHRAADKGLRSSGWKCGSMQLLSMPIALCTRPP